MAKKRTATRKTAEGTGAKSKGKKPTIKKASKKKKKKAIARGAKKKERKSPQDVKIEQALDRLLEFYEHGIEAQKRYGELSLHSKATYNQRIAESYAEELGRTPDYTHKSREFADRYTQKEFDALCRLRRQQDGLPLFPSHVIRLLRVSDKKERRRIEVQAAKENWSTARIADEVTEMLKGPGSQGGRRPQRPSSKEDALRQLLRESSRWLRWAEVYNPTGKEELPGEGIELADLPESLHGPFKGVLREMRKLKVVAEEL